MGWNGSKRIDHCTMRFMAWRAPAHSGWAASPIVSVAVPTGNSAFAQMPAAP